MRTVLGEQFRVGHFELLAVAVASALAIAGLLYFNWLVAVSRSVSSY
jgi:hypothetical protein